MGVKTPKQSHLITKAIEINNGINTLLEDAQYMEESHFDTVIASIESVKHLVETYKLVRFG